MPSGRWGRDPFQSTHPLRGATPIVHVHYGQRFISIHAPLAGCDSMRGYVSPSACNFNPRTPCGVRRITVPKTVPVAVISIHAPLAGCDPQGRCCRRAGRYFNPRTPCGVRRSLPRDWVMIGAFQSTHPLRGATRSRPGCAARPRFQSTHPLRGATLFNGVAAILHQISIHAPLAGCDRPQRSWRPR